MASPDCIFCRIASGGIPSRIVLNTPECAAFLDAAPLAPGHTLLVPKTHYVSIDEMSPEAAAGVLRHLPALGRAVVAATGAAAYNILQNNGPAAGQVVMHVHFHIIPRREGDGLGFRWLPQALPAAEADAVQARIAAAMTGG